MRFANHRDAARALLEVGIRQVADIKPREGQFLGGIAFDLRPLSEKQANWLRILLDRYGLSPLDNEGNG